MSVLLDLVLDGAPSSIATARSAAAQVARDHGLREADVKVAISEAVTNAVMHGYRGKLTGTVRVTARVEGGKLVFVVRDEGVGMSPNPDSTGLGLGLQLIGSLAEDLRFDEGRGGTVISFGFPIGPQVGS